MKNMKRALSVLLTVVLILGLLTTSVSAAGSTAQRELKAQSLFAMGLFKGYDDSGKNFGLNDRVTREQALVFLIRMLGLEKEALNWKGSQPYSDVPNGNWAKAYIGYAKQNGLTVGIGNNKFGMGRYANMQEMTIFALRGLGYSDASSVKDFNWNTCLSFAKSKGILDSDKAVSPFTRGEAVDIIFGSMGANIKGKDYDLLSKLMNQGVVTQTQYDNAMKVFGKKSDSTDLTAQNKKLLDRYNSCVDRYNKQVDQINALGLSSDKNLTDSLNEVTSSVNAMGKEIGEGTGIFTAAEISEYNTALDSLDSLMSEIDELIRITKAEQSASRTIYVHFTNGTDTNFTNFKAYTDGSSSTAQTLAKDYGEATLEFTVVNASTPFTVSFTAAGTDYELPFTFDAGVKSDSTISIKFSANEAGEVVWDYNN